MLFNLILIVFKPHSHCFLTSFSMFWEYVWGMFGPCLGLVWAMFGPCLGNVWDMFGAPLGHVWDMCETLLRHSKIEKKNKVIFFN